MHGHFLNELSEKVNFTRACEGGGACVEVARLELYLVRDSKNPEDVQWYFANEWSEFVGGVKAGQFDFD